MHGENTWREWMRMISACRYGLKSSFGFSKSIATSACVAAGSSYLGQVRVCGDYLKLTMKFVARCFFQMPLPLSSCESLTSMMEPIATTRNSTLPRTTSCGQGYRSDTGSLTFRKCYTAIEDMRTLLAPESEPCSLRLHKKCNRDA